MSRTLICSRCKIVPDLVCEEGHQGVLLCPGCGVLGDWETVVESAAQHVSSGLISNMQNRRRRQYRGSKTVRYVPGKLPNRPFPDFIFE